MGATNNSNNSQLIALQERKKNIEEALGKKERELVDLCLREAELTGSIPAEMPIRSVVDGRRKVGTSYQLSDSVLEYVHNHESGNGEENIADLELRLQIVANMAEAALGLAREENLTKTVRRQRKSEYQNYKKEYKALQDKIATLKENQLIQTELQQKQQKKKPRPVDKGDAISVVSSERSFEKTEERRSARSLRRTLQTDDLQDLYVQFRRSRPSPPLSQNSRNTIQYGDLSSSFYKLNIDGYRSYLERSGPQSTYNTMQSNYPLQFTPPQQSVYLQQYSPQKSVSPDISNAKYYQPHIQSYENNNNYHYPSLNKPSPTSYPYKNQIIEPRQIPNPLQLGPHQQYEVRTGLGGCWKQKNSGEMIWCDLNSLNIDPNIYRNKKFGSLDGRKNRRLQKRASPNTEDTKSATFSTVSCPVDDKPPLIMRSPQVETRYSKELVRTRSLGSVGVGLQNSDDNSSCDGDRETARKRRQRVKRKEWVETSLDGSNSPTPSIISHNHSIVDENFARASISSKSSLEIPAESRPSSKVVYESNADFFSSTNVPKNCTVVQAGACKPYREETKPFEMSDFYKYSTKFKKPKPQENDDVPPESHLWYTGKENGEKKATLV